MGELENLTRQRTELLVAQRTQHEKLMAETRRRLRAERRLSALRERCGSAIEQLLSREAAVAAELQAAYELLAERAAAKVSSSSARPIVDNSLESNLGAAESESGRVAYSRGDVAARRDRPGGVGTPGSSTVRCNNERAINSSRSVHAGAAIGEGFSGDNVGNGGDAEGGDMLGQSISIGDILHDGEDDDDSDAEIEQLLEPAAASQSSSVANGGAPTEGQGESVKRQNSNSPGPSPNDGTTEGNTTATTAFAQSVTVDASLPQTASVVAPNQRAPSPNSSASLISPYTPFSGPPDATSSLQLLKPVDHQHGKQPKPVEGSQLKSHSEAESVPHKDGQPWPPSLTYTHHWTSGAPGTPEGERVLAQAAQADADYHAGVQRRQPAAQLAREHREQREQALLAGRFPLEKLLSLRKKSSSQVRRKQGKPRRPASASAAQGYRRQFQDSSLHSNGHARSTHGVQNSSNHRDDDFAAGASNRQHREASESSATPTVVGAGSGAARDAAIAAAIARDRARVAHKVNDTRNWHCGSLRAQHLNHATAGLARHPPMAVAGPKNPYIPR